MGDTDKRNNDATIPGGSAPYAARDASANDDRNLLLFAEEIAVQKEEAETGRVRVKTHTVEREALVSEDLLREYAEIETVPVGKRVFAMPTVRHEGDTTIVPIVEEVLHTERHLFLKEEVHIRKVRTTERFEQPVRLRRQEALIERSQDEAGSAATAKPQPPVE